jgi:hypothetical protein
MRSDVSNVPSTRGHELRERLWNAQFVRSPRLDRDLLKRATFRASAQTQVQIQVARRHSSFSSPFFLRYLGPVLELCVQREDVFVERFASLNAHLVLSFVLGDAVPCVPSYSKRGRRRARDVPSFQRTRLIDHWDHVVGL